MTLEKGTTGAWLKRKLNVARAASGLSWGDIATQLSKPGAVVTANSLRQKHSRSSFTAVELVAVLQVLGIDALDVRQDKPGAKPRRRSSV